MLTGSGRPIYAKCLCLVFFFVFACMYGPNPSLKCSMLMLI